MYPISFRKTAAFVNNRQKRARHIERIKSLEELEFNVLVVAVKHPGSLAEILRRCSELGIAVKGSARSAILQHIKSLVEKELLKEVENSFAGFGSVAQVFLFSA